MFPHEELAAPVSEETVDKLRKRLILMKEILGEDDDDADNVQARKKIERRKKKTCFDTIIDGSFMGIILAVCLGTVMVTAFFAYKNLYFALMRKIYPEPHQEL